MHRKQLVSLSLVTLTACGFDPVRLQSGTYDLQSVWTLSEVDEDTLSGQLDLDVDLAEVSITDASGDQTTASLDFLPRRDWATGCPGNFDADTMEVAVLSIDELVVVVDDAGDAITVAAPILVAECGGGQDNELVLRDDPIDGDRTGTTTACGGAEACLSYAMP